MNCNRILEAESESQLFSWLQSQHFNTPALVRDRSTRVMEHRAICLYLSHLYAFAKLTFPISIWKRERPDYKIIMDNIHVGLEVTQVFLNNYQELEARIENKGLDTFMDPSHFRSGSVSKKKIRKLSEAAALTGEPYMGDAIEREWASEILAAIHGKSEKAKKDGYQAFENNELLLLNHLPRQPGTEASCSRLLQKLVIDRGIEFFGRVSILCGEYVFVVHSREVSWSRLEALR